MRRRALITAVAAAGLGLAAPSVHAQGAAARTLRFVPQAGLSSIDPVWGTQYVVRNAALLVWDMLYGIDSQFRPQPQMAEGHETSADALVWTIRLREGLRFHDGAPVRGADVVASLERWMVRDPMGQMIRALRQELSASDDRTVRLVLSRPYPKLLHALGKQSAPCAFIMPERLARTDPFAEIDEAVGSGPMRFRADLWDKGRSAVFERFAEYAPRQEQPDWLSGGKRMALDRIEWRSMAVPDEAAAALDSGTVDWVETVLPDLAPGLRRNRSVAVEIADPMGAIGAIRFNHLFPPFDDVRVRRAVAIAADQGDFMRAVVGADDVLWRFCPSFFTPGTPLYSEEGGEILSGPRDLEGARRLVVAAGQQGAPVVLLSADDVAPLKAMADVSERLLGELGLSVERVATDWGSVAQRRARKDRPDQGGWNVFHTWHAGADCATPASYTALRTNGPDAWFGWPSNAGIEAAIAGWFAAEGVAEEREAVARLNAASMEFMTWVPNGLFMSYQAWRRSVSGVGKGPMPVFWGVQKT
ncbi:ABC transporter substrate-binding protein [Elioraea rosea]|uniref:ABC transporter substrate-binding protein n=1 Tax=Elioraea rosea TaxID=2492390 RepID=UPI001181CAF3|nr:ABC transporter substrate-binding protein [Elioraea rosea]